jgi:hypothetical protein
MGLLVALRLVGEMLQRCVYLAEYELITAKEWDLGASMRLQRVGASRNVAKSPDTLPSTSTTDVTYLDNGRKRSTLG